MKSFNVFLVKCGFEHAGSTASSNYDFLLNKNIRLCNWYL
ncbi:MAG: hypothetical protein A4E23_00649 [Methanomethylovorans sp. PtaU1.Bin073]|nr:MAG: hypothetical protein A4E23_00649 [Methanomethylovorans sp. PtaU1.Bin073]